MNANERERNYKQTLMTENANENEVMNVTKVNVMKVNANENERYKRLTNVNISESVMFFDCVIVNT